ncbi:DUF3427 domain-containing protein [Corynebacterium bovis]|uniref:DUF3427 domain-containing protein n=1 Tax=Corynebacterium bovis TaxID=36808 RepID=A0A426Q223_9CORY|nr:DUF3427 domain-containing protein [Corynebacterium bovis]RRQ01340.1 DUF3427 domain-containing protein [Corynebacterium bovis]RRQ07418.1 DUF3427 domain-containing protein [Corynebacterium bovis]
MEWNIRLSSVAQADEIRKFRTTFDSYWNDPTFEDYDPDRDGDRLDAALAEARGWEREATAPRPGHLALAAQTTDQDGHAGGALESAELSPRLPGLTARPHQQKILDLLDVQRTHHDRHTNLVVAATGTGKTVIAALDYARLVEEAGRPLRLLFVAHRDEILRQARSTFRSALAHGTFGELFVGGEKPRRWDHVFASIQSLNTLDDAAFSRPWDVVILDECHHAEAASYQRLLTRVTCTELLGLTATPERADGVDITKYFGGRVTAEVRLWDALSDNLLCPFHYFGIADQTDLRNVSWDARGGYSIRGLEEVYTADTIRAQIIVKQLRNNVADVRDVKAIGFCVSRAHATFMKEYFVRHGIAAEVVLGDTAIEDRQRFIRELSDGQLQCIFTVDVFNEGVDIPSINTLLMLRPTESPVVFAQQLGRGLRHSPGKDVLTVLDFVGLHRQEFDLEQRFVQLTGTPVRALRDEVEQGFPSLAGASRIILDTVVADEVIARLKRVTASATIRSMAKELAALGETTTLGEFLDATGRDLADIYRSHSWTAVRRAAGFDDGTAAEGGPAQLIRRFTTVDDDDRLDAYAETAATIRTGGTVDVSNPWVRMFLSLMKPGWTPQEKGRREWTYAEVAEVLAGHPELCDEIEQVLAIARERVDHRSDPIIGPLGTTVLRSHGTYHQVELLVALQEPDAIAVPATLREGVRWIDHLSTDLLFITLDKDEGAFTPSTMYRDIPVSDHLFDWESQSRTTAASPTGQRYVTSSGRSTEVLLAVRRSKTVNGSAAPYVLLGSADYVSHHGDAPMSIQWELRRAMPPEIVEYAPMSG